MVIGVQFLSSLGSILIFLGLFLHLSDQSFDSILSYRLGCFSIPFAQGINYDDQDFNFGHFSDVFWDQFL